MFGLHLGLYNVGIFSGTKPYLSPDQRHHMTFCNAYLRQRQIDIHFVPPCRRAVLLSF